MSNLIELKSLLKKLPASMQQGVIASNSEVVFPYSGTFEGEYYTNAYALYAGRLFAVGTFQQIKEVIKTEIEMQEI